MPAVSDQTVRKLQDLPDDDQRAFDVLAGGLIRAFDRLNRIEAAYRDLRTRVSTIEDLARPAPIASTNRRTTMNGAVDTRGSTAASRFALRQRG